MRDVLLSAVVFLRMRRRELAWHGTAQGLSSLETAQSLAGSFVLGLAIFYSQGTFTYSLLRQVERTMFL